MSDLLELRQVRVHYPLEGKVLQAVRGVSFGIREGEAIGIVGESGCGKSSIAQAIPRLLSSAWVDGNILFEGEDLLQKSEAEMRLIRGRRIGMIFQDPMSALNPTMTIGAQIEEALVCHHLTTSGRALELLEQVELSQAKARLKQYPHQLSGGMRQRVLIAIALSCKPRLLIADEPTSALDGVVQAQILTLLRKREAGTSLLLITHDMRVASALCDRILVAYAGKIVEQGLTSQVLSRPRHPYTQMLLRCVPRPSHPRSQPLQTIEGVPPDLISPPKGCAFAARCPFATPICESEPPLAGSVACWRESS